MTTNAADNTPRVWVGCLACYNGAVLVGDWFDAVDAPEDMDEFNQHVDTLPHEHHADGHEELWVMDHENFHGLISGECSPSVAKFLAEEVLSAVDDRIAFGVWYSNDPNAAGDDWPEYIERFEEAFCGWFDSEADYARDSAEETGSFDPRTYGHDLYSKPGERPEDLSTRWPFTCIDWDHAWRGADKWGSVLRQPIRGWVTRSYETRSLLRQAEWAASKALGQ